MMLNYSINNNFSEAENISSDLHQFFLYRLCEPVYDDKDRVKTVVFPVAKIYLSVDKSYR